MGDSNERSYIKIQGVLKTKKQQLKNIAIFEGYNDNSAFFRIELNKIIDRYPDDIKNPPDLPYLEE